MSIIFNHFVQRILLLIRPDEHRNDPFIASYLHLSLPDCAESEQNGSNTCNYKELRYQIQFGVVFWYTLEVQHAKRLGRCSGRLYDSLIRERAVQPTSGNVSICSLRQVNAIPAPMCLWICTRRSPRLTTLGCQIEVVRTRPTSATACSRRLFVKSYIKSRNIRYFCICLEEKLICRFLGTYIHLIYTSSHRFSPLIRYSNQDILSVYVATVPMMQRLEAHGWMCTHPLMSWKQPSTEVENSPWHRCDTWAFIF